MTSNTLEAAAPKPRLGRDFWIFLTGQTISNLGSAFTTVALPLLVFNLTQSAFYLGLATAVTFLPYLLFGLVIGAWVDRTNRKRLMIISDCLRAVIIGLIPLLAALDLLSIWMIYAVMFVASTVGIGFSASQFTAIPNLVDRSLLVTANSRFAACYSAANALGPILVGVLVTMMSLQQLLLFDALSFLLSAISLMLIKVSFNASQRSEAKSIWGDVSEGLRYVWNQPVLRSLTILVMATVLVGSTLTAQIVFFAKRYLEASDSQASLFYAAAGIGWFTLSLLAGVVRKYASYTSIIVGLTIVRGILLVIMVVGHSYWLALLLWGISEGITMISNIYTMTLRQMIAPGHMLGRVLNLGQVTAWCFIPLGTFIGGLVIEWSQNVGLIYALIGGLLSIIGVIAFFSPLGQIDHYLSQEQPKKTMEPAKA